MYMHVPAIIIIIVVIAAVLLSCIHRSIEPKDQSHDQTSHHKSSNNGSNIQVGSNHSLPLGNCDSPDYCILLTLDQRGIHTSSSCTHACYPESHNAQYIQIDIILHVRFKFIASYIHACFLTS